MSRERVLDERLTTLVLLLCDFLRCSRLQPAGVGVSMVYGYVCVCCRGVGQGGERGETWLVFQWEVSRV